MKTNNNINENKGYDNNMRCTKCGEKLRLVSSSETYRDDAYWNAVRRKYVCDNCKLSYDTVERFDVIKPKVFIIKGATCEPFSEQKYLETLEKVMVFPFMFPTVTQDIIDSWYMYALHHSNSKATSEYDISELRVAYTIDDLVEFTVRKLCKVGLDDTARDYLVFHSKYLISNELFGDLMDEFNLELEEDICYEQ